MIPKRDGGFRRVHNLSYPHRQHGSVNAGLDEHRTSYTTVDDAALAMRRLGKGCFFVKLGLMQAYRHIRVLRDDWSLLGMRINNEVYVDCFLPFGASSAPFIFNTVADGLAFIMKTHLPADVTIQHYLEDFLILAPSQASAKEALTTFLLLACLSFVSVRPFP